MKKILLIGLVLVMLSVSVSAFTLTGPSHINLTTDKLEYSANEVVNLSAECFAYSVLQLFSASKLNAVEQGISNWNTQYSNLAKGKYTAILFCDDKNISTSFCYDSAGCLTPVASPPPATPPSSSSSSSGSSSGGSSRGSCTAKYTCGNWTKCSKDLNQTRVCKDDNCGYKTVFETQSCGACQENWECKLFSACKNGQQRRTCIDLNSCGTYKIQPKLTQSCKSPTVAKKTVQQPSSPKSFVEDFMEPFVEPVIEEPSSTILYAAAVGSFLFIIALIVVIVLVIKHHSKNNYNFHELVDWIIKEEKAKTSREDITQILKDHTKWNDKEIKEGFAAADKKLKAKPKAA